MLQCVTVWYSLILPSVFWLFRNAVQVCFSESYEVYVCAATSASCLYTRFMCLLLHQLLVYSFGSGQSLWNAVRDDQCTVVVSGCVRQLMCIFLLLAVILLWSMLCGPIQIQLCFGFRRFYSAGLEGQSQCRSLFRQALCFSFCYVFPCGFAFSCFLSFGASPF